MEPASIPDRTPLPPPASPAATPPDLAAHLLPAAASTSRRRRRRRRTPRRALAGALVVVLAAWAAGLLGAYLGTTLADRRDAPPRRASTLAVDTAPAREEPFGPIDIAAVVRAVAPSVVAVQRTIEEGGAIGESNGTGVIVTSDGEILTNAHVVGDADEVNVRLPLESEPRRGAVVATDPARDLALVRIDVDGLQPATFADPGDVRVGDEVVAVGYALDLDGDPSVTSGIVSATDRTLNTALGALNGLVQTDAAISSGNSGGPLVDAAGHVVGINTAVAATGAGAANDIGFAIAVDDALAGIELLRAASRGEEVEEGYLGVGLDRRRDGGSGALVTTVEPGSPAAGAGVESGDVVVAVDGDGISGPADLIATIRRLPPGTAIELTVVRGDVERDVRATLVERPSS